MPEQPTRRGFARSAAGLLTAGAFVARKGYAVDNTPRSGVRPTREQLDWQESELSMFLHFGMNTFTDREWGEGTEDPRLFHPTALDADQWASVAKSAGFRYVILTAKHHDGFCLWPSRYTEHSVRGSRWREGKGDVVGQFAAACRRARLKVGLYVSPWDRHERTYGDSPVYNRHFVNQLDELLTQYGEISEVWFDGACGEGPNGKRQEYDWDAYYTVIRKRQPKALIAICGPDIRWVGNEDGFARETEWSVQPAPNGARSVVEGKSWYPAECDVSIRPGWFWHRREDTQVKSLAQLADIYLKSVGRNSVLLLNVPPNSAGVLADPDVARLAEWRAALDRAFSRDLARGADAAASSAAPGHGARCAVDGAARTAWSPVGAELPAVLTASLREPATFDVLHIEEAIDEGQRVSGYEVAVVAPDGGERVIARGTTIGHKRLQVIEPTTARVIRLRVTKSEAAPLIRRFSLYSGARYLADAV